MKIGYLMQQDVDIRTPPFDGPANHVREVIQGLQGLGHDVRTLFRLGGRLLYSDDLVHFETVEVPWMDRGVLRLLEKGVRRVQYELQMPYAGLFESVRFALACREKLAGLDIFLERMSWANYGSALAARWLDIPLILENNGDHLLDLEAKGIAPEGMQRRLSFALTRYAVKATAHIVVSGNGWRDAFIERWDAAPERVTTVENGTRVVELLERKALRAFRDVPTGTSPVTLVYLGSFYPWQGVPVLLRALARVRKQGVRAQLLLIGSGPGVAEARSSVAALGLGDIVTFTGRLRPAEYAPLLADAAIGVAPYCDWPEFSGLKLFDYKAAGLATIGSGRDGRPATLRHGETGYVVPPCDEEALAHAIVHLAQDANLRRQIGRAARVEAERHHRWEHTVRRLEEILLDVVVAHAPGSDPTHKQKHWMSEWKRG